MSSRRAPVIVALLLMGCGSSGARPAPGTFTGSDKNNDATRFELSFHVGDDQRITRFSILIECPDPETRDLDNSVLYGRSDGEVVKLNADGNAIAGDVAEGIALSADGNFKYVGGGKGFEYDGRIEFKGHFEGDGTAVSGSWELPTGTQTQIVTPNGGESVLKTPVGCAGDWSGKQDGT